MSAVSWYVTLNGVEQGPFEPAELKQIAESGGIDGDTPIRRDGMARPVPARQVKGLLTPEQMNLVSITTQPSKSEPQDERSAPASRPATRRTARGTGRVASRTADRENAFAPPTETIGRRRDSQSGHPRMRAGFGIRTAAHLIDTILTVVVMFVMVFVMIFALGMGNPRGNESMGLFLVFMIVCALFPFGYWVVGEGVWGATLGKKICGLTVVDKHGRQVSFGAAFLRNFMRAVFGIVPLLPLIDVLMCLGEEKTTLHDRLVGTLVVYRSRMDASRSTRRITRRVGAAKAHSDAGDGVARPRPTTRRIRR